MFFKKKYQRGRKFSFWPRMLRPEFGIREEAKQGIFILLLIAAAVLIGLSFLGKAGEFGVVLNSFLTLVLGSSKWTLPFALAITCLSLAGGSRRNFNSANLIGLFLFFAGLSSLMHFFNPDQGGGILGQSIADWLLPYVGPVVAAALFATGIIISLLLLLETSLSKLLGRESLVFKILALLAAIIFSPFIRKDFDDEPGLAEASAGREEEPARAKGFGEASDSGDLKAVVKEYEIEDDEGEESEQGGQHNRKESGPALFSAIAARHGGDARWPKTNIQIDYPFSLLKNKPKRPTSGNIERNQAVIKRTLSDFGIPASMGEVRVGPTVTQYTFKPAKGISVSRVKALSEDLALELALHPVRIEAPIPGKSLVGLEVPNQTKVLVTLKEVIQSKKFRDRKSNTMIALGRDVTGNIWLDDLAGLPHLLVAGATGSGKSIFLHSLITSLLYQNNPDDLKMILIDVKQVELTAYNGMPYLAAPVITDSQRAVRSLQWCLNEMDRRLEILSKAGCQNIRDYNKQRVKMPYLVVVVDELGDIMSLAKKEAEAAIIRLGQKARAAGIHLVLAMQRPSVDILSGLIKANMPGRISFQVTSGINSKTILDFIGAEKLIGQGDMLFINAGMPKPVRIQGAYIGKEEVNAVVRYAKRKAGKAEYIEGITDIKTGQLSMEDADEVDDELLEQAKEIIFEYNKASASMLQSRLSIGYPRANRILDILEKQGLVGPSVQNKPREVYSGGRKE